MRKRERKRDQNKNHMWICTTRVVYIEKMQNVGKNVNKYRV